MGKGFKRALGAGLFIAGVMTAGVQMLKRTQWGMVALSPAGRQKGNPQAAIVITEFSDFQCPACAAGRLVLNEIYEKYKEHVLVVYKHYPLRVHKHAHLAAKAAECAQKQRQFWKYHDLLFERQKQWSELDASFDYFLGLAQEIGLSKENFAACLNDPKVDQAVNLDVKQGQGQNINSTPTFFINEFRLAGGNQLKRHGNRLVEALLSDGNKNKNP